MSIALGGALAVGDGVDDARGPEHHVAARKDALAGSRQGHLVGDDRAPAGRFEPESLRRACDRPIGSRPGSGCRRRSVNSDPSIGHGARTPARVRLSEFHADALDAAQRAVFGKDLDRGGQVLDIDALRKGRLDFGGIRRHLLAGAAVEDRDLRAPSRTAVRAASMAVLPPPTTTTRLPRPVSSPRRACGGNRCRG